MTFLDPWAWQNRETDFGETGKPVWPRGENPDKPKDLPPVIDGRKHYKINAPVLAATGITIGRFE